MGGPTFKSSWGQNAFYLSQKEGEKKVGVSFIGKVMHKPYGSKV